MIPWLSGAEIASRASLADVVAALREEFATAPTHLPREHLALGDGDLLIMPAVSARAAGVKLVTVQPRNPPRGLPLINGCYVLFDADTGVPSALLDGAALTALRTPAMSAIATVALARADAHRSVIVGGGVQAAGHLSAMRWCLGADCEQIVVTRTGARPDWADVAVRVATVAELADVVPTADVISLCTSAGEPLFDGSLVSPGTHLNVVGSYRPNRREVDAALVMRSRVFVDDRAAAAQEAGDLLLALADGWSMDRIAGDLVALASGRGQREDVQEITMFKSVGLAVCDLVVAQLATRS
jgi:ornithine cyclodeaminase